MRGMYATYMLTCQLVLFRMDQTRCSLDETCASLDTCRLSLSIVASNCIHSIVNLEHASSIFRLYSQPSMRHIIWIYVMVFLDITSLHEGKLQRAIEEEVALADAAREDHRGLPTYLIPRSGVLETWHLVGLYRMTLMFKMLRSYWPLPVHQTLQF